MTIISSSRLGSIFFREPTPIVTPQTYLGIFLANGIFPRKEEENSLAHVSKVGKKRGSFRIY